jgi:Family of unknown function (DUF6348)
VANPQSSLPHPLRKGNPGVGVQAKLAFTEGDKSWTEQLNVVDLTARALEARGHSGVAHNSWIEHPDSGFIIMPQIVGVEVMDGGGVHSITTIQIHHPTLVLDGVFEYQHAWGDSVEKAMYHGFEQWAQVDFAALLDALRPQPKTCMTLSFSFPEKDGKPAYHRRAILSPVAHYMTNPPAADQKPEAHPFCPCCLLTNTHKAFLSQMKEESFYAVRFFAARRADGSPQADCRVNGEDFKPGMEALCEYVKTWPGSGYEFRKQYVLLHTVAEDFCEGGKTVYTRESDKGS